MEISPLQGLSSCSELVTNVGFPALLTPPVSAVSAQRLYELLCLKGPV